MAFWHQLMKMIRVHVKGNDFSKAEAYLKKLKEPKYANILKKYGEEGVEALRNATPVRSGVTAASWSYKITESEGKTAIEFHNDNINTGVNIAVILQTGHGTGTGGWVQGIDYINPVIQPLFEKIADEAWKEVTKT